MSAVLEVSQLTKAFGGLKVTRAVDLSVARGERHLLIGPNGAGKTTLFNLIAGDLRADAGAITLLGKNVTSLSTHQRAQHGLARTYQILTLFNRDTLLHNVMLALLGKSRLRWKHWGGFGSDAALAAQVLLLDEPLAGLSAEERDTILCLLQAIPRSVTIVMIEHDMEVALAFADSVTLLHYGEVITAGSRQQVVDDPRTKEIYLGH